MRVLAEIEVQTKYSGTQKINKVEIFVELDTHKHTGWLIRGTYGDRQYSLGYYYDKEEAVDRHKEILDQLLQAQEERAELLQ